MNNINVKAGQVWTNGTGDNFIVKAVLLGPCNKGVRIANETTGQYGVVAGGFAHAYRFVPQNDLEWLAVKVKSLGHNIKFIARRGSEYLIFEAKPEHTPGLYASQQHQNMRYHLGLDKKPHYRLTGGEWVKQC